MRPRILRDDGRRCLRRTDGFEMVSQPHPTDKERQAFFAMAHQGFDVCMTWCGETADDKRTEELATCLKCIALVPLGEGYGCEENT